MLEKSTSNVADQNPAAQKSGAKVKKITPPN
jgi:hypothetical protein